MLPSSSKPQPNEGRSVFQQHRLVLPIFILGCKKKKKLYSMYFVVSSCFYLTLYLKFIHIFACSCWLFILIAVYYFSKWINGLFILLLTGIEVLPSFTFQLLWIAIIDKGNLLKVPNIVHASEHVKEIIFNSVLRVWNFWTKHTFLRNLVRISL